MVEGGGEEWFKEGSMVEVSSNEQSLRGSWFTATVLRSPSRRSNKILIQYKTLVNSKNKKKPLTEFVDLVLIRPIPPREPHRSFQIDEEVDAFHNDGWWEGIVIAVLDAPDAADFRYSVFFRQSREQIDFDESMLRLHREWVYGEWVPPLEERKLSDARKAVVRKKRKRNAR